MNPARNAAGGESRDAGRHAVVIGGSIAGMLAAHVLAGHVDRVTVVERDHLPEGAEPRSGVPQGRHPHGLLEGGQRALDTLLPGFTEELRKAGAPRVGLPSELLYWQDGGWHRRFPASTDIFSGSRAQLEHLLRRRVLANGAITVAAGTQVVGLSGDASRVRGVLLHERGEAGGQDRRLAADLVVDASGRSTKAAQWLTGIGAEPAHEETIDTGLAYATRVYRDTTGTLGTDTLGCYLIPNPTQPHAGVVLPLEDGRFLATLSGLRGDEPPADAEEWVAYAKRLPHPFLHRWLNTAEPESPVFGFRQTANIRRRYDLPGRRPAGFLAIGDALCTFNPIYGQGMAVAAMNAVALRDALAGTRGVPTTRRVQRALLAVSRQAWDISAGADRTMPGARGNATAVRAVDRPAAWYLARVQARYTGDEVVSRAFRAVLALAAPVTALFAPQVVRSVLFGPVPQTLGEPPMKQEAGA